MAIHDYNGTLGRVFARILEQLAYTFADPPESAPPAQEEGLLLASMIFNGPSCGTMYIVVPCGLAPVLAANILGLDADTPVAERASRDALKELLSVTCGNALTELFGDEPIFELSVPEIAPQPTTDWDALRNRPNTVHLAVEDFPVLLHLSIENEDGE